MPVYLPPALQADYYTICTSSTRPGSPSEGLMIYETDTKLVYIYNGSAWIPYGGTGAWTSYTPTWEGTTTNPVLGNGTAVGKYMQIGKTVICEFRVTAGSTTTYGAGTYTITLPVLASTPVTTTASGTFHYWDATGSHYYGAAIVQGSGLSVSARVSSGAAAYVVISATAPVVPAVSDLWEVSLAYEAA